ncbi:MAG: methyltransferase domain-containing protein [Chloroflexi bacterium]|nr:methyltransferase domain-containing protein [Chloroflexota bacterium]
MNPSRCETTRDDVDWAAAWREHLLRSGLEANLSRVGLLPEEFWTRFGGWVQRLSRNGYPGVLLERVMALVRQGDSVLDVGAGAGTYALPLARVACHVTAVEPSPVQAGRLAAGVREEGLSNLSILPHCWEELDPAEIGVHDLVLAAHCFQMHDIRAALSKMCRVTRRSLILIHAADNDLTDTLRTVLGVEPGPNYIYLYNTLCQMGFCPDVDIVTRTYRVPLETQMDMFRCNPGLSEEQCRRLRHHLEGESRVSLLDGQPSMERRHSDAVIHVSM